MVSEFMQRLVPSGPDARPSTAEDAPMNAIVTALRSVRRVGPSERGILIGTDCLYFDRTNVVVAALVGRKGETVVVHDDGGAEDRLAASGRKVADVAAILRKVARRHGLLVENGQITSRASGIEDLAALIPLVANASQEAASALRAASTPRHQRDIVQEAVRALISWRPDLNIQREFLVTGASSRPYHFDIAAEIRSGALLLIEAVSPDATSINAAAIRNLDVGRRTDELFARAIVYDRQDEKSFGSANLALLASVASTLPVDALSFEIDGIVGSPRAA